MAKGCCLVAYRRQHVLLDVGPGTGSTITTFVQGHRALEHELQVHAFEPNPTHHAKLRTALRHVKTSLPTVIHEAAAWIADEEVGVNAIFPHRCLLRLLLVLSLLAKQGSLPEEVTLMLSGSQKVDKPSVEVFGLYGMSQLGSKVSSARKLWPSASHCYAFAGDNDD